jgi:DNA polymerase III epsilon subunit-like protein
VWPEWSSHKLNLCCERLGIPLAHHDPLSDALAAAELYLLSMGRKLARLPTPAASPLPRPGSDLLQQYTPESAEQTGRQVARGEVGMPLDITDPWLGRIILLAHANERLRQDVRALLRQTGWTREEALERLGLAARKGEQGPVEAPGKRPAVHPRTCGGCGTKGLSEKGQCTRCGWVKPGGEEAA